MAPKKKLQVFISSTYSDLRDERQAAVEAILTAGHIPAGMELFAAGDESQMNVIKRWIDESDIYMLILGGRYGTIEPKSQKSYTQLEYEYATEKGKPIFSVVVDESYLEKKVKRYGTAVIEKVYPDKLEYFRKLVCSRMVRFWRDTKDIKLSILETLTDFSNRYELTGWILGSELLKANSINLADRTGFNTPIQTRLENARSVYILGLNLVNFIAQYQDVIENKAMGGCEFKIITLSPDFFQYKELFPGWHGGLRRKEDLIHTLKNLEHIFGKTDKIQAKFLSFPPPFSLLIINPDMPEGEAQVELYTYQHDSNTRPHFILKKAENEKWFVFFRTEFEYAWEKAMFFTF